MVIFLTWNFPIVEAAADAAPLASMTDSGMSLGPERFRRQNTGLVRCNGSSVFMLTNPDLSSPTSRRRAVSIRRRRRLQADRQDQQVERVVDYFTVLGDIPYEKVVCFRVAFHRCDAALMNVVSCRFLALSINWSKPLPYARMSCKKWWFWLGRCSCVMIASFAACMQQMAEHARFPPGCPASPRIEGSLFSSVRHGRRARDVPAGRAGGAEYPSYSML